MFDLLCCGGHLAREDAPRDSKQSTGERTLNINSSYYHQEIVDEHVEAIGATFLQPPPTWPSPVRNETRNERIAFSSKHTRYRSGELFQEAIKRDFLKQMLDRLYDPKLNPYCNRLSTNSKGEKLSTKESLDITFKVYHGEGGPMHPQQVALRNAEPSKTEREKMFLESLTGSWNKALHEMSTAAGNTTGRGSADDDASAADSTSIGNSLLQAAATLIDLQPRGVYTT